VIGWNSARSSDTIILRDILFTVEKSSRKSQFACSYNLTMSEAREKATVVDGTAEEDEDEWEDDNSEEAEDNEDVEDDDDDDEEDDEIDHDDVHELAMKTNALLM